MPNVLICSYLEPEHISAIRSVHPAVHVEYHPDLIPRPRYVSDHIGEPFERTSQQDHEWSRLMRSANILFDFDHADRTSLLRHGSNVQWVQATSAGIARTIECHGLSKSQTLFTTAAGVHARPLAEFVVWSMLAFAKRFPVARRQQREQRWERFVGGELSGAVLAIIGLGSIGREVAQYARSMGMRVIGMKRTLDGVRAEDVGVDEIYHRRDMASMLGVADYVCLVVPHTNETEGMFDTHAFAAMKQESVLINIGRGALVDEEALLGSLEHGSLGGAVLDVTATEPLPETHPLWYRDDVIIFPHSASTSLRENERITALFTKNLRRFLEGATLFNVYDPARQY